MTIIAILILSMGLSFISREVKEKPLPAPKGLKVSVEKMGDKHGQKAN